MKHWIFQGNPDIFDIDAYLRHNDEILWTIRQRRFEREIQIGDEVFIWRAAGKSKAVSGIIARGTVTGPPELRDDPAGDTLWVEGAQKPKDKTVSIRLVEKNMEAKKVVKREWLKSDPIVSDMRILRLASETNYQVKPNEASRLAALVRNTGRDWTREESIAGLWAYAHTLNSPVSKGKGSPISRVALAIGRAVPGVYNKVMNFRAIDPTDSRAGFSGGSSVDKEVWAAYFDQGTQRLSMSKLDSDYAGLWGDAKKPEKQLIPVYQDFGEAPNDDPDELQVFAARVRRGQAALRKNLIAAYGGLCAITGHGPEQVLEAVHIVGYAISGINKTDNGLLLRADLHSLFDAGLLRIDPGNRTVVLDPKLSHTPYWELNGKTLRLRADGSQISEEYLAMRWKEGGLIT